MKKRIASVAAAIISAAALTVSASAYNGYILVQNTVYSFRNGWNEGTYGRDANNNAFDHMTMNGAKCDEGTYEDYEDNYDYDIGTYLIGDFTDAEITGEGTYRVSVNNFDWTLDGATSFNLLEVSTDLPVAEGWVCTSITAYVDGVATQTVENPINHDEETAVYVQPCLANIYNPDIKDSYTGGYPTKSLEVEVTIAKNGGSEGEVPADLYATDGADPTVTAGDVAAATDSSKGSPDTGIEDVAAIAGLAVLAGAGIVFTRRRK